MTGTPLRYSCLENPMDGGAWWAAVHGVAKSRTRLSGFPFTFHFPALEKEMATHSSVLAWRIPGTGKPGKLLSMGSHRVGHDWSNSSSSSKPRYNIGRQTDFVHIIRREFSLFLSTSNTGQLGIERVFSHSWCRLTLEVSHATVFVKYCGYLFWNINYHDNRIERMVLYWGCNRCHMLNIMK